MPSSTGSFELSVSLGENSFSASGKHDLVLKAFEDFKALTGRSGDSTVPKRMSGSSWNFGGGPHGLMVKR